MNIHPAPPQLPIKRQPVKKDRVFRRIFGKTGNNLNKSRAAVNYADPSELEGDVPNMNVGRAMVVIVLIHVICLFGYFLREKIARDRAATASSAAEVNSPPSFASATILGVENLPPIRQGDRSHFVMNSSDTYTTLAQQLGVDEATLREANNHVKIVKGLNLRVPPRVAAAIVPTALERLKNPPRHEAITAVPEVVMPDMETVAKALKATPVYEEEKVHVVKKGETLYSIARVYGVTIKDLVKANHIKNASALPIGASLKIPAR